MPTGCCQPRGSGRQQLGRFGCVSAGCTPARGQEGRGEKRNVGDPEQALPWVHEGWCSSILKLCLI